jgi:hypothetical protein
MRLVPRARLVLAECKPTDAIPATVATYGIPAMETAAAQQVSWDRAHASPDGRHASES